MMIRKLLMVFTLLTLSVSPLANAVIINFEGATGTANSIGAFVDVGDYRFTLDAGTSANGFETINNQSNIVETGTTKLFGANHTVILMTRVDGGLFNLNSFDLGGSFIDTPGRWASSVDVLASDSSFLNAVVGPTTSYNNVAPSWANITSVQWAPLVNANQGSNNYEFTLDNINVTRATVPNPATFALLCIGLFGLRLAKKGNR